MTTTGCARRTILLGTGAVAAALPWQSARAAYPEGPLTWIVAYAPGGGTDTLARLLGQAMGARLGQPIVVENRPGAATTIAAAAVAKAAPDGLTLFTADNGTLVFNTALFRTLRYDPQADFRPVGLMARFPLVLAVKKDSTLATAADFVARAKAAPGALDYASPGVGSPHHLTMARLASKAGISLNHVPYKGAAPALNDLVGGQIESMIVDFPSGAGQIRSGGIRALAVCSAARLDALPDVPTAQEALGLPGFEAYAWQGLVVPAATPDSVVQRLTTELAAALAGAPVQQRMREIGLEPLTGGPDTMATLIATEREVWLPLIKTLNVTLD